MTRVERELETTYSGPNGNNEGSRLATPVTSASKETQSSTLAGYLMRQLLSAMGDPAIEIALWNGDVITTSATKPIARVYIPDRITLIRLLRNPLLKFGEGFCAGSIVVEGDLTAFLCEFYRAEQTVRANAAPKTPRAAKSARGHSIAASRDNIHHHYDIGNDFYSLWLGDTMAYTCAYFPTPEATLNQAQLAKMRHVSRKLRLQPGQHVVEAGCGWGAQALLMAREFGVKVTAFNISKEQIEYARTRVKAAGLEHLVEYVEDDYRNIGKRAGERFDAFISIGMLEHVGVAGYPELGRLVRNCIKPSGLALIHSIGRNRPLPLNPWIEKHIFPAAYTPSLGEMMGIFESNDLSVLDVENIRLHYAKTLHHWRDLFEQSTERIAKMFDETFVRMWRLYLAGSEAAFLAGEMQLFQVLFSAQANNDIPWTRADIYKE